MHVHNREVQNTCLHRSRKNKQHRQEEKKHKNVQNDDSSRQPLPKVIDAAVEIGVDKKCSVCLLTTEYD